MALSVDSKIKVLMKSPEATAIIVEYAPEFATNPQMKMVQGLTFRKLAAFPQAKEMGISDEVVEEIDAKLKALG